LQPFTLSSTISPQYIDRATPASELPQPRFTFSLLISLPSEPNKELPKVSESTHITHENDDEEEWAELPELVIGTTDVLPIIVDEGENAPRESKSTARMVEKLPAHELHAKDDKEAGTEVQHVAYAPGQSRPARWERYDVIRWRIEGMR
jgi:hypothetical protein